MTARVSPTNKGTHALRDPDGRINKHLATREDLFLRSPFRANVRIAEWTVRPLGVFGDMLMLERQWKTLKLRPWG